MNDTFGFVPVGSLGNYSFVVIVTIDVNRRILLSRKKAYNTWEFQGGHIENGESPLEAAKRELYEEAGLEIGENIWAIYDYYTSQADTHNIENDNLNLRRNGMIFLVKANNQLSKCESEMQESKYFSHIPNNMTYPEMSKWLENKVLHQINNFDLS